MKRKICIVLALIILAIVAIFIYWFKRGDACLTQPPYFNCHTQNKLDDIDNEINNLSGQILSLNEPSIFNIDKYEGMFSFNHIGEDADFGVGRTRITKNGEIKDSLGFYTNYIDPILTPLTKDTLIGSAWQWPQDSKLYNGPFTNYYLNFKTRKTVELPTKGKLVAKSQDGRKVVFLESECDKNPPVMEIDHSCNNQNLSLRLINLSFINDGYFITHFKEMKLLDFNHVVFSPDSSRIAIEAKIKSVDYDTVNEYWTLFIFDPEKGEIIKQNNRLSKNRYENVFWSDNENVIYW
ncbi:MAG TPA: hypothetical protein PLK76_01585 [bacterium]|nr:hypothetical protein [bacterium]